MGNTGDDIMFGEVIFSAGTMLCEASITDSDMINCNHRILENTDSMVGEKLWAAISKIGIVPIGEVRDQIFIIEEMELADKERQKVLKANKNVYQ